MKLGVTVKLSCTTLSNVTVKEIASPSFAEASAIVTAGARVRSACHTARTRRQVAVTVAIHSHIRRHAHRHQRVGRRRYGDHHCVQRRRQRLPPYHPSIAHREVRLLETGHVLREDDLDAEHTPYRTLRTRTESRSGAVVWFRHPDRERGRDRRVHAIVRRNRHGVVFQCRVGRHRPRNDAVRVRQPRRQARHRHRHRQRVVVGVRHRDPERSNFLACAVGPVAWRSDHRTGVDRPPRQGRPEHRDGERRDGLVHAVVRGDDDRVSLRRRVGRHCAAHLAVRVRQPRRQARHRHRQRVLVGIRHRDPKRGDRLPLLVSLVAGIRDRRRGVRRRGGFTLPITWWFGLADKPPWTRDASWPWASLSVAPEIRWTRLPFPDGFGYTPSVSRSLRTTV